MNNSHTESPNRKRLRDENPSSLTSPEQDSNKRRRKKKNKNKGQDAPILQDPLPSTNSNEKGSEQNEQLHLCPNPNAVTLEKEQGAEPNVVITEPSVSDSASLKTKKKRKRKKNVAVAYYVGEPPNSLQVKTEVRAVQPQVCHKHELANPVVQEKGDFVEVKEITVEQPQYKQEHQLVNRVVEHIKEIGVGKNEGVPEAEHPQVCPKTESACPVHTVISMEPEVPTDPEQKLSKKKKKKKKSSALNNEVAEPDKHNSELPEIPVQTSICPIAASQIDQNIPTDSATPIELKSKKKKRKKKKSALKSDGSESDKHNAYSTAGIPVNEGNVEQPANAPLRRSKRLKQKEALLHMSCMPSQKLGSKTKLCRDANRKKICYFCRNIGHSLSNCSVSQAGGRFAWCLFCYSNGHFTKNCPRNGIGIDPKANAASGMAVSDECKLKFLELKAKRNYRFIVFKIENQQVILEKLGSPEETYEDFTGSLPPTECRYAVFDFDFTTDEKCQKSKIFFIAWSPDTSKVREKMVYASSKDRFKRELDGIQVELQATDPSEMSFDIIKARAI